MVFVDGLAAYLQAYLSALVDALRSLPFYFKLKEADARLAMEPLSYRRALFLLLFPLFLFLQLFHIACLGLDHLFFPTFRTTKLRSPVFVVGVPRSGTTFLHRELAQDPEFTAPRTWELLFAPSLCQRYVLRALGRLDHMLGAPLARTSRALFSGRMSGVNEVHPVGLGAAEEDYLALLPCGGCFFAAMAFPGSDRFHGLAGLDGLSPVKRTRILDHYHALLQRQVFFHGNKQLLSKNAAFAAWTPFIAARYPDATILMCIRDPATALASQLSSLQAARDAFGTYPHPADLERRFRDYYEDWWQALVRGIDDLDPAPLVIEQEWLRHNRVPALALIYSRLKRELPAVVSGRGASTSRSDGGATPPSREPEWLIGDDLVAGMQAAYAQLREAAHQEREMAS
ncbi:MAG: sulfotransferase [Pseudomonadota bacterium]